jgi:ABC-type multidrug transport system fused ATPase/permease subunit
LGETGEVAGGWLETVQVNAVVLHLDQFHGSGLLTKDLPCPVVKRERGGDDAQAGWLCGENGSGLSGGEKQRISIARSLLKKA